MKRKMKRYHQQIGKKACALMLAIATCLSSFTFMPDEVKADGSVLDLQLAFSKDTVNGAGAALQETNIVHQINKDTTFKIKYTLAMTLSAADFDTDEVVIEMPGYLLNYRSNDGYGTNNKLLLSSAGITSDKTIAATNAIPFYYTYSSDSEKMLIKNAKPLSGANTYNIEIEYTVNPKRVVDLTTAKIQAIGSLKGIPSATSNELSYQFDTDIELKSMTLNKELLHSWNASTLGIFTSTNKPVLDVDHYRYISYEVLPELTRDTSGIIISQPYDYEIDMNLDNGGEIVYAGYSSNKNDNIYDLRLNELLNKGNKKISVTTDSRTMMNNNLSTNVSYFIVVAYPKNNVTQYHTKATTTLFPKDNPLNASSDSKEADIAWMDYNFTYPSNNLTLTSKFTVPSDVGMMLLDNGINHDMNNQEIKATSSFYPRPDDNRKHGLTVMSDVKYLADKDKTTAANLKLLTSDDVYINKVSFNFLNTITDRNSGEMKLVDCITAFGPDAAFTVSYKVGNNTNWTDQQTIYFKDLKYEYYFKETKKCYTFSIVPPSDATQVKVDMPSVFTDKIEAFLDVGLVIKKDSPQYQALRNKTKDNQGMKFYAFAGAMGKDSVGTDILAPPSSNYNNAIDLGLLEYDKATYGGPIFRAGGTNVAKSLARPTDVSYMDIVQGKTENNVSDTTNQIMNHKYHLRFYQSYRSAYNDESLKDDTVYDTMVANGLKNVSVDKASFFVLLPRGATVATSTDKLMPTVTTSNSNKAKVDVHVVSNNYKGTHCQLVEFKVSSNMPDGANTTSSWGISDPITGTGSAFSGRGSIYNLDFFISIPYSEVGNINGAKIISAAQLDDNIIGTGYPDTGVALGNNNILLEDGTSVFHNLAGKDDVDNSLLNTMYASNTLAAYSGASAFFHGLQTFVRTNDVDGISMFQNETSVLPTQEYEYRLFLSNGKLTDLSDLILFHNIGQGTDVDTKTWRGTFKKVDLSLLEQKNVKPIVYYTTVENAPYFKLGDAIPSEWTLVKPNDKDIKGIAIDISKKKDGTDFVMEEKDAASVYVTMEAPSTLPSDGAQKELSYASYSGKIGNTEVLPDSSGVYTQNTITTLLKPELRKESSQLDWVKRGDSITYTLSYTNETDLKQAIKVRDEAPTGTSFAKEAGKLTASPTAVIDGLAIAGADLAKVVEVDTTRNEIVWKVEVPAHKSMVLTFQVNVKSDQKGSIFNQAEATIEKYTFPSNEVENRVEPNIKKEVDKDFVYDKQNLTYRITYTNEFATDQKVVIEDTLPIGTAFLLDANGLNPGIPTAQLDQHDVNQNWEVTGNKIRWEFDKVPSKSTVEVTFKVRVDGSQTVENKAYVYLDDALVAHESNMTTTHVDPTPSLLKSYKNLTSVKIMAFDGDVVRYECVFKNTSTLSKKVVIKDRAPDGTDLLNDAQTAINGNPKAYIDQKAYNANIQLNGDELVWTFDDVKPNEEVSITFDVVVNKQLINQVDNVATLYLGNKADMFDSNLVRFEKTVKNNPVIPPNPPQPSIPVDPTNPPKPVEPPTSIDQPKLPTLVNQESNSVKKEQLKTGDSANHILFFTIALLSSLGFMIVINRRRKHQNKEV